MYIRNPESPVCVQVPGRHQGTKRPQENVPVLLLLTETEGQVNTPVPGTVPPHTRFNEIKPSCAVSSPAYAMAMHPQGTVLISRTYMRSRSRSHCQINSCIPPARYVFQISEVNPYPDAYNASCRDITKIGSVSRNGLMVMPESSFDECLVFVFYRPNGFCYRDQSPSEVIRCYPR